MLAVVLTARASARDLANARLWLGIAIFLALLAINKQLDLQSLLTALAREDAQMQGWYEQRRRVQAIFILGLLAGSIAAALGLRALTLHRGRALRTATYGVTFLLLFVCVRAASFHRMDEVLHLSFLAITVNHVLELGGIALVGVAAATAQPGTSRSE